MPPQIIELPDGSEVEFPEGMPTADIEAALRQQQAPSESYDFAEPVRTMGKNILRGVTKLGSDTASLAVAIPKTLAQGAALWATNPAQAGRNVLAGVKQIPQMAGEQIGDAASRLGKIAAHPIQSLTEEPVETAMDIAGLVTAAGPIAKVAGSLARRGGRTAYTKALKLPTSIQARNKNVDIVPEALERKLPVSEGGIAKNQGVIGATEDEFGRVVDTSPVQSRIALTRMPKTQETLTHAQQTTAGNPRLARVGQARVKQFLTDPNVANPVIDPATGTVIGYRSKPITQRSLQEQKKATGGLVDWRDPKRTEANQVNAAMYDDLRNIQAQDVPEVAPINRELSVRYAIQQALEHRVPVAGRRDVLPMAGAIGSAVVGGRMGRLAGAVANIALTNPNVLSRAAIRMNEAGKTMQGLAKTSKALAPYATMATFARAVTGETPTGQEARDRGQIVTRAVNELAAQPGFEALPLDQRMQAFDRLVDDAALLLGGVADATKAKNHGTRILQRMIQASTTERP